MSELARKRPTVSSRHWRLELLEQTQSRYRSTILRMMQVATAFLEPWNPNNASPASGSGEPDAEHVLFEAPEFTTAAVAAATGSAESAGEKMSARARKQPARFRPARPAAASTEPVDAPKPACGTEVIVAWRPKRRRQETDFLQPTEVLRDMATGARKRKRPAAVAGPCLQPGTRELVLYLAEHCCAPSVAKEDKDGWQAATKYFWGYFSGGAVGKPPRALRSGLHVLEEDMVNLLNESA